MKAQGVESFAELKEGERPGVMSHRLLAPLPESLPTVPEPGLVLEMWALLLPPKSGSRLMDVSRGQAVACVCHGLAQWFGLQRTFKDHVVPAPQPWAGTPLARPD